MFVIFQFFKKFIITVIPLIKFSEMNVTALLTIKLTLWGMLNKTVLNVSRKAILKNN